MEHLSRARQTMPLLLLRARQTLHNGLQAAYRALARLHHINTIAATLAASRRSSARHYYLALESSPCGSVHPDGTASRDLC